MGFYRLRVVGLSLGLLGLLSCKGNPGPGLKLQVAESASQHSCIKTDKSGFPLSAVLREGSVRLSVLQKQGTGWQFQCDLTAKLPDEHPSIDLGAIDRNQYAFFAELFDPSGKRVLTGAVQGKSSVAADGGAGILPMFEVESWNCPASGMGFARAFHAATALPGGEVLLYGGVETGAVAGQPESLSVTDTIEIYDPARALFQTVSGSGLDARAFHQVAVLSATDTVIKLLAYGGIKASGRGQQVLTTPLTNAPLRLAPCGAAAPAGPLLLTLKLEAGKWSITGEKVAQSDTEKAVFAGTTALPQGGLVGIGGASLGALAPCPNGVDLLKPVNPTVPIQKAVAWSGMAGEVFASGTLMTGFLAPSLTPISKKSAIALGSSWPATATAPPMMSLLLTGVPDAPATTMGMGQALTGVPTAFHTATRIGAALLDNPRFPVDVLLTGGFQMTDSATVQPGQPPAAASSVRVYSVPDATSVPNLKAVTPYLAGTCGSAQPHYRSAAYEAAAATASGQRVVITGGSATQVAGCNDCENAADTSLLCTLTQASLYDAGQNALRQLPAMALARFGHQATLLQDGTILVTGGLTRKAGKTTEATSESEIYNPRAASTATADLDDPVTLSLPTDQQSARVGVDARNPCTHL